MQIKKGVEGVRRLNNLSYNLLTSPHQKIALQNPTQPHYVCNVWKTI